MRRWPIALVVACLAGAPAGVAVAQTATTPTDQTITTPQEIGQDLGDGQQPAAGQAPATDQASAPAALPATGWHGRYALGLGLVLLGAGLALRRSVAR